jgi:RsiW-degrading membrane proteinase PrsW (M82 family)
MTFAVLVIWLVGAAVTKFTLEQMALLAPVAVVVVGATIGVVMLWVKIIRQSRRDRQAERAQRDAAVYLTR